MTPEDITVVVLTKNEARNVARALQSAPHGAHKLVVDAESTDETADLARAAGADVVVRPWAGFVATRRFALTLVTTPWTLMVDADEALDETLRAAIAAAIPGDAVAGYQLRRINYFCGRPIAGAGWGDERLLRLFRTRDARVEAQPAAGGAADVHERWVIDGDTPALDGALHHDSYPTVASYREKFARYTSLEASGTRADAATVAVAMLRATARLGWLFVVRGGWRDGWRGAYISAGSAAYPAVVALKAFRSR